MKYAKHLTLQRTSQLKRRRKSVRIMSGVKISNKIHFLKMSKGFLITGYISFEDWANHSNPSLSKCELTTLWKLTILHTATIQTCARCGLTTTTFRACSVCNAIWYCDARCQRRHLMIHRTICKPK